MARYYLNKRLTITGLIPGSMIGVWKSDHKQRTFQQSQSVFLEQCQEDSVTFCVPDGELVVRVRNPGYYPSERRFHTSGVSGVIDGSIYISQTRDCINANLPMEM